MKTFREINMGKSHDIMDGLGNKTVIGRLYLEDKISVTHGSIINESARIDRCVRLNNAMVGKDVVIEKRASLESCKIQPGVHIPKGMYVYVDLVQSPQIYEGASYIVYFTGNLMYYDGFWRPIGSWKNERFLKKQEGIRDFIHNEAEAISQRVQDGFTGRLQARPIRVQSLGMAI